MGLTNSELTRSTFERCSRSRRRASLCTRTWPAMSLAPSKRSPASSPCTPTRRRVSHSILSSRIHTSFQISTGCEKFSKSTYSPMPRNSIGTQTYMVISSPIISRNSLSNRGHSQNSRMTQQVITTPCRHRCPRLVLWCSVYKRLQPWGISKGN
jgi:hypothetical protein